MIRIGPTEENILREITEIISARFNNVGVFNRVFSRIKTKSSIAKKLEQKRREYVEKNKKMQDIFGVRVTLYFLDDEIIAEHLIKDLFEEVPDAHSIDSIGHERFGPIRHNLVFRINEKLSITSSLFDHDFIDSTFEVQLRTVFSEGWHEVEHDLRYKCKEDWQEEKPLSRQLNGQLASLETCDWAMLKIFDELAYKKYKTKEWASFFRNFLRIRFDDDNFSPEIIEILNENPLIVKDFLRMDRGKLIMSLTKLTTNIPLKMDNVLFALNRAVLKNPYLEALESPLLSQILMGSFPGNHVNHNAQ